MQNPRPTSFVIVVQGERARAMCIMAELRQVYPSSRLRHATDLSEAYNLAEHEHPDLVILDAEHATISGLSMFLSLLAGLSIDWTMITRQSVVRSIPDNRQVEIGRLAHHLAWRIDMQVMPKMRPAPPVDAAPIPNTERSWKTVLIGASTGGIEALIELLSAYPADGPPTMIVQHINPGFVPGLAQRLDRHCRAKVRPARDGDRLRPGLVLLAPGDEAHLVLKRDGKTCQFEKGPKIQGHRPSVDALFTSGANANGRHTVGVILSGMGQDGARGLGDIRNAGGWTIAQNRSSCAVYGMPRAAKDKGAVTEELSLAQIPAALMKAAAKTTKGAGYV